MKQQSRWLLIFVLFLSIAACGPTPTGLIRPNHRYLSYQGRTDRLRDGNIALISSAAPVILIKTTRFRWPICLVHSLADCSMISTRPRFRFPHSSWNPQPEGWG
ncbi:MAG: hypothetical protein NTV01_01500 [Bacteroidia bacterium]|nr:hypothetical protein [Bacteroidia bacterium]